MLAFLLLEPLPCLKFMKDLLQDFSMPGCNACFQEMLHRTFTHAYKMVHMSATPPALSTHSYLPRAPLNASAKCCTEHSLIFTKSSIQRIRKVLHSALTHIYQELQINNASAKCCTAHSLMPTKWSTSSRRFRDLGFKRAASHDVSCSWVSSSYMTSKPRVTLRGSKGMHGL